MEEGNDESFTSQEFSEGLREDIDDILNNPQRIWTEVSREDDQIISVSRDLSTNLYIHKVQGIVDTNAAFAFNRWVSSRGLEEWDIMCTSSEIVQEYSANKQVVTSSFSLTIPAPIREFVFYRYITEENNGKDFYVCFRSVEHKKAPRKDDIVRAIMYPSGIIVSSLQDDPPKCQVTLLLHFDLFIPDMAMVPKAVAAGASVVGRFIPSLRDYIRSSGADLQRQYLYRMELAAYKDMVSLLSPEERHPIIKQNNIEVWMRKVGKKNIMCASGVFVVDVLPAEAFEVLETLPPGVSDPLNTSNQLIEKMKQTLQIWYVSWKGTMLGVDTEVDTALLRSSRTLPENLYIVLTRSVVHNKVPVTPGKLRASVLPSGYFIHPTSDGKQSLITYCIQMDMDPYQEYVNSTENSGQTMGEGGQTKMEASDASNDMEKKLVKEGEQVFAVRIISIISSLRNIILKEKKKKVVNSVDLSALAIPESNLLTERFRTVSKLCYALIQQHDEKERLTKKLRTRLNTKEFGSSSSDEEKKRQLKEESSQDEEERNWSPMFNQVVSGMELLDMPKELSDNVNTPPGGRSRKRAFEVAPKVPATKEFGGVIPELDFHLNLAELPTEVLFHILQRLDYKDVSNLSQVNKRLKFLTEEETLWKTLFQIHFPEDSKKGPMYYNWRNSFRTKILLSMNWSKGRYRTHQLDGHQKGIRCIEFNEEFIVTGASDKSVRVWSSKTRECLRKLGAVNSGGVLALALQGSKITCAYKNGAMRSWDAKTGDCLWEKQFNYWAEGFCFVESHIISWDLSIDLWSLETGKLEASFNQHTKKVNCIKHFDGKLVSGSSDKTVKLWDITTKQCVQTFAGHSAGVTDVDLDSTFVVSASNDKLIKIWNIASGACVAVLKGHVCPIKCVQFKNNMVVSGAGDNTVRIWNAKTGECMVRLNEHKSSVTSLKFDEKKLIAGSSDGKLIIWDFTVHL